MRVIGYRVVSFEGRDRQVIEGVTFFCTSPIEKHGEGDMCEKIFLPRSRLDQCGYHPAIGDDVDFTYNKYGKAVSVCLLE